MLLSPNCAKIKFVASSRNSVQEEMLPKNYQESQDIMSPSILLRKIQERLLGDHDHQRDHKMSRIQGLPQRSMLSKLPRDPSVQKLPREVHIVWSRAFRCNFISLYCKRPIIGADEPNIVKANLVQACNQKKSPICVTKHIVKVLVTCWSKGPSI